MTVGPLVVLLAVGLTGLVTAALVGPVLRRLPEPDPAEADGKPPYAGLATRRFILGCAVVSAAAAVVSWTSLPGAVQPLWTVLSVGGVLLAAIDATLTWLPLALTRVCWAAMAAAAGVGAALGGGWMLLGQAAVGAAVLGAVFWFVWWLTEGGFGFGDVRFVPLVGAAAAAADWPTLAHALVAGSAVGAGHGVVRLVRRRPGGFAYAPALLAGGYLGVLWTRATG